MAAPEIKFCGLTRAEDAACAVECGATYAGAIFAGGPRLLDVAGARAMFAGLSGSTVQRVGVFAASPVDEVLRIADATDLHVLQLHDGATAARLLSLRERFSGAIWAVVRVSGSSLEAVSETVLAAIDAVVLDTAVAERTGGTGVAFDWSSSASAVRALSVRCPVVLAGGLRPANVQEAVRLLAPRVVDVSSGVEASPGIKDPDLMRAFALAARANEE
ncbi:MAG: phosphoribosylanthranilate isomerase [Gemmatimonadetes bacterium]|nr:phosphoribosylanthranilate isomerase [Gemmatimonadota bacterium]